MKELSIEEKALRYNEVIERANSLLSGNQLGNDWIYALLPELKESEDERICKWLIALIKSNEYGSISNVGEMPCPKLNVLAWLEKQGEHLENYNEAEKEKADFVGDGFIKCYADFLDFKEGSTYWLEYIGDDKYNVRSDNLLGKTYHITPCQLYTIFKKQTWLEKQSEQKTTNKVEPKFKVGDWIINTITHHVDQIIGITNNVYICYECPIVPFENQHLLKKWAIQDAKDGDILATDSGRPFVFKGCFDIRYPSSPVAYCGITISDDFRAYNGLNRWTAENVYPATEEQRELLFQKMREAGYEWVSEKGLHKIEDYIQQKPL